MGIVVRNLMIFCMLIGVSPSGFSQTHVNRIEVIDPWDWIRNDQIKVTRQKITDTKDVLWVAQRSLDPSIICHQPILVFVGGFVPTLDQSAYKTLIEYLAKRNIAVIYPEYITPNFLGQLIDVKEGFHTDQLAKGIEDSIRKYIQRAYRDCQDPPKIVLYGHSLGARVVMSILQIHSSWYNAAILDGVGSNQDKDKNIVDYNHLWSDDDKTKFPSVLATPLTVIHYEADKLLLPFTNRAYDNVDAYFKQYFEIKSYHSSDGKRFVQADHFSPMSGPIGPIRGLRSFV